MTKLIVALHGHFMCMPENAKIHGILKRFYQSLDMALLTHF